MLGFRANLNFAEQVESNGGLSDACTKSGWRFEKFSISEGCLYSWAWGKACAHQVPPCLRVKKQSGPVLKMPSVANSAQR